MRLRGRRILRRFPISVGAAHWAARGFRTLHTFLQPCRGDPCGRPSAASTARPGGRALQGGETSKAAGHSPVLQVLPGLGRGGPWASRWGVCMPRKHPHPPPSGAPSPLEGEGLSGRVWDPPLRQITKTVSLLRRGRSQTGPPGFAPKALARQSQAQRLNRTSRNFCTPRAQWPGWNLDQPLRFCAPEGFRLLRGVTLVNRGPGKAVLWT